MRPRILSLRSNITALVSRRHFGKQTRCDAHMNELPVPCGPWDPWYKAKQGLYNKMLMGGALWFALSFVLMVYSDSIYFNWGPPQNPAPPSDMVENCEDIE